MAMLRRNAAMTETFTGNFTQQEPIPEDAIAAALAVLQHGRIHRYNLTGDEAGETALLEREFADQTGAKYCLAVASGGYALATALRAVGVKPGDKVLTNAFTLAPVPGSIASVGAEPVFVGVTEGLVIDLDDLAAKADQAKVLMLSHMRGHLCDMERLMAICDGAGIAVIEDCAHTMGASWKGRASGRWGAVAALVAAFWAACMCVQPPAAALTPFPMLCGSLLPHCSVCGTQGRGPDLFRLRSAAPMRLLPLLAPVCGRRRRWPC